MVVYRTDQDKIPRSYKSRDDALRCTWYSDRPTIIRARILHVSSYSITPSEIIKNDLCKFLQTHSLTTLCCPFSNGYYSTIRAHTHFQIIRAQILHVSKYNQTRFANSYVRRVWRRFMVVSTTIHDNSRPKYSRFQVSSVWHDNSRTTHSRFQKNSVSIRQVSCKLIQMQRQRFVGTVTRH